MLDPKIVTERLDEVRAALARRSSETAQGLDQVRELAERRRALIGQTEHKQAERNQANQEMSKLAKSGDRSAFAARRDALRELSDAIKGLESELGKVDQELQDLLLAIPNTPHESVPDGASEADNPVVRTWGEKPKLDFKAKDHWELGEALGILDFERGAKLSGARFTVLAGAGARLERVLGQYMIDLHTRTHDYTEIAPPELVKADALLGTGQLPKFEKDLFKTGRGGEDAEALYLIPTAEVPVTNLHMNEILEAAQLPLAYTALTGCFRSEAGSYGKDVRGLIRQHQFRKVELVRFCQPEIALEQLELLTSHAEAVLQGLGLHYRVVELCAGDLGFGAAKTYDLEVWLPGQEAYREISSCSVFTDYQARRAKIRYRPEAKGKPRLVNTLNGSGVAVGRALVAVLEQYQQADGSVRVPEVLRGAMGTDRIQVG